MEVHRQHHLGLQTGRESDPPRRPVPVGAGQRRGLQVSQDQAREEVPSPGQRRGLSRAERSGGRQGQPGDPVERHVGTQTPEVSAEREEGQMQEALSYNLQSGLVKSYLQK